MGIVFDIQRGCIDDGPGIRTTVFFKGCPLKCIWCHNPESKSSEIQQYIDHTKTVGYICSVKEVMSIVRLDKAYYKASGGGITVSGGEPLMQPDFLYELLSSAKAEDIHTCIETSGYTSEEVLKRILPVTDLFLYDIKATAQMHKELTGVENNVIIKNLQYLYESNGNIILRCPIIPTKNDSKEHFAFLRSLRRKYPNIINIQLMPYHNLGVDKERKLGLEPLLCIDNPSKEQINQWNEMLKSDEK
ncbi:glycyl-radical enzyme activating protein [Lacrimispora brassicae]